MSDIKRILPSLDRIQKIRSEYETDEEFIKEFLGGYDILIGPSDSMDYIYEIKGKVRKNEKERENKNEGETGPDWRGFRGI